MKHEYAGITIELGYWVEIIDVHAAVPVFHRQDDMVTLPTRWYTLTACGLKLYEEWAGGDGQIHVTNHARASLPTRLAVRFARPCTKCWPVLRGQRSLFSKPRRERQPDVVALPS